MNLKCNGCGAALVVEERLRTALCPYCASPSVIQRPASPDRPEPQFALPFGLTDEVARQRVAKWLKRQNPFCRAGVRTAKVQQLRGVYVPAYIYSATARSKYSASIGEEYTELRRTKNGTRTETKTEWCSLSGEHLSYVPDVLVTASTGLPNGELEAIEPFDLRLCRRMSPALLSGWMAEEPSMPQEQCLAQARDEARGAVARQLARFMPGDKHRELRFQTRLEDESLALALVPVWVLAARYDPRAPPFRVLVNGQTGEVQGKAPLSPLKISVAVVAALLVVAGALLASGALR